MLSTTLPRAVRSTPIAGGRKSWPGTRSPVYFFLDFSNIAISARRLAAENGDGVFAEEKIRLNCSNLRHMAQRNRRWGFGYATAGLADQRSPIKECFEREGISFEICERGRNSGSEQNVDERIQLEMLRLLKPGVEKGTVVLATGDGNGFGADHGFVEALSILHSYQFCVEVMSWRHSFNHALRSWAFEHGRAIDLDDFYSDITFVEGGRAASAQSQLSRKLACRGLVHTAL